MTIKQIKDSNGTVHDIHAVKATQDANGNVITSTYETKSDATAKLNTAKSYTDSEISEWVGDTAVATQIGNAIDAITPSSIGASESGHTHSSYANQNAFSNVTVGSTTIAADSTTDTLTLAAGSNITLTPDATNDKITIAATDTVYTHPTTAGNKHIPSGGSSGQILRWSADGTAAWGADNNTTYSVVSTTADGLAPKRDGSTTKFLRGDGTWAVPPDTNTDTNTTYSLSKSGSTITLTGSDGSTTTVTDSNTTYSNMTGASSSAAGKAGLVPAPAKGKQSSFLRGDGTWATPTNTKNTAGSTNSSSKLFLIGATSQATNPTTYSHDTAYVGTDGCLYSGGKKVLTGTTETALDSNGNTWHAMNTDAGTLYVGCYYGTLNFSIASGGYYRPSAAIPFTPTTAAFSNSPLIDLSHCYPISVDYCIISGSNGLHECYISDWNETSSTFSVWPWGNASKTVTANVVVTLYNPHS